MIEDFIIMDGILAYQVSILDGLVDSIEFDDQKLLVIYHSLGKLKLNEPVPSWFWEAHIGSLDFISVRYKKNNEVWEWVRVGKSVKELRELFASENPEVQVLDYKEFWKWQQSPKQK